MGILFTLAIYYNWFVKQLNMIMVYFNLDIDIYLYIKLANRYNNRGITILLKKLFIV